MTTPRLRLTPSGRSRGARTRARGWTACILAALWLMLPLGTGAATPKAVVTAGTAMGLRGGTDIPVSISLKSLNGAQVVGLNFDLTFHADRLSVASVALGSAASSVGKSIAWSQPDANRIRVLIVGLNLDAIPNGTVAVVTFNVLPAARRGATPLALTDATASDPATQPIAVKIGNGAFRVVTRLR
jgi:Cohesin domain